LALRFETSDTKLLWIRVFGGNKHDHLLGEVFEELDGSLGIKCAIDLQVGIAAF